MVVGVSDGDTISVLDSTHIQHKIRLASIDAPERAMPFSNRAKRYLSALVAGQTVEVETGKVDRYGRRVGKVLASGQDVNFEMVKAGMAWHYKEYDREQSTADRRMYAAAEELARAERRGLWEDEDPTPPWL